MLDVNTSEPVSLEVYYGLTSSTFYSQLVNQHFQSNFEVNLSGLVFQGSTNYLYFKLIDSTGLATTYSNNSNYYLVFIPKIDTQAPYNTTTISLSGSAVLSFKTNEAITVSVLCTDKNGLYGTYECGSDNDYKTNFAVQLQFPLTGTQYVIQQVVLTDKAGNVKTMTLNYQYNYN